MNLIFSLNLKEGGRAGRRVMERQDGEITGLGNWDEGIKQDEGQKQGMGVNIREELTFSMRILGRMRGMQEGLRGRRGCTVKVCK